MEPVEFELLLKHPPRPPQLTLVDLGLALLFLVGAVLLS
jgi:hypothetical protein